MRQCFFITPMDCRQGFNLAGFSHLPIEPAQLEATVQQSMGSQNIGMIVIDERLLAGIDEDRLQALERRWDGIVVILPRPAALVGEEEDFAMRLIRRAVGYQLRLSP